MLPQDIEKYGWKYYSHEIVKQNPNRYNFFNTIMKRNIFLEYFTDTNRMIIFYPINPEPFVLGDINNVIFNGYVKTRQQFECLMEMLEIIY